MSHTEEKYISLLTDFGFKRIFGTEVNAELLKDFLNSLFNGKQVIKSLRYLNSEHLGDIDTERKAIFDVYCENEQGEKFIVEMQNAYQKFFKDRSIFYSTFPIRDQAEKGTNWDFNLKHVYTVGLLNFDLEDRSFDKTKVHHEVKLCDTFTHEVFYDKLTFIYVEIAKFNKSIEQLESNFDKWLYILKYLPELQKRPKKLQERVFDRLFEQAEIAKLDKSQLKSYEDSRKAFRDVKNSIDTAKEEGRQEGLVEGIEIGIEKGLARGREEGKTEGIEIGQKKALLQTAKMMKEEGLPFETIAKYTGLSQEEIKKIQ